MESKKSVTKKELMTLISQSSGVTRRTVEVVYDAMASEVAGLLGKSTTVPMIGIGTLSVIKVAERNGFNPSSGVVEPFPAHNRVKFKPSKQVKDVVNTVA